MWSYSDRVQLPNFGTVPEKNSDLAKEPFLSVNSIDADTCDHEVRPVNSAHHLQLIRLVCLLAFTNGLLLCAAIYLYLRHPSPVPLWSNGNDLARATSAYSPILNVLPIKYHDVLFNGTLYPPEKPAWSRLLPGKETDAIWDVFEPGHAFPLTREDVIAMGKDPETTVKFPDSQFHLGEAYVGTLDVLHKLHCLNTLRQSAFADYGVDAPVKQKHGKLWWLHLQHCVDMLAQDLQCHASADVITYNWVDTQDYPFPDFSIHRTCRDFDSLVEWRDANRVSMHTWGVAMNKTNFAAPGARVIDGTQQVPFEPAYYKQWGFGSSDLFPNGKGYVEPFPVDVDAWFGETREW